MHEHTYLHQLVVCWIFQVGTDRLSRNVGKKLLLLVA